MSYMCLVRWASTYSSSFRRMSVSPVVFLAAAILCLRRGLRLLDGGVLCFGLRCRLAVELLQVRVAGCGILVCHVRLVCDAEDFGGFAFRRGYDDLEAEARQHGQRAFRVASVGFDEGFVQEQRGVGGLAGQVAAEQVDPGPRRRRTR